MKKSEEVAKKLIEIDKKLYVCLARFNELKSRREKILQYLEKNKMSEELKLAMTMNIKDFDQVLHEMQDLEKQTKKLKQTL